MMRRALALLLALCLSIGAASAQTGTLSGGTVTATGSTTARTLADRAGDTINVLDWGAKCDGTTVDTVALQAAINAGAGKAPVLIPNSTGANCLTGQLNLPSNTNLILNGSLFLVPGHNQHVLNAASFANVSISGSGLIDGNAANNTGISAGVEARIGTNLRLSGITIQDVLDWPFNITLVTGAWVSYVTFSTSGHSAEFANATNNCWADHLNGSSINDEVFAFYGGVFNCGISDSQLTGATLGAGIAVLNDVNQTAVVHDIVIANNLVAHNWFGGISSASGTGGAGQNYNLTIVGNRGYDNNTSNTSNQADIILNSTIQSSITGNTLGPSGSGAAATNGITLSGATNTLVISGNVIFNEGVGGIAGVGIAFTSAVPFVLISGNSIFDNQTSKTMAFAINGTLGSNVQLIGNSLGPTISGTPDHSTHNATTTVNEAVLIGQGVTIGPSAIMAGPLLTAQATVSGLATCNAALKGALYSVTDATAPTYGATLTGGGTVSTPVYCDGAAWSAH